MDDNRRYEAFVRNRITELREQKGVSEHRMSLEPVSYTHLTASMATGSDVSSSSTSKRKGSPDSSGKLNISSPGVYVKSMRLQFSFTGMPPHWFSRWGNGIGE